MKSINTMLETMRNLRDIDGFRHVFLLVDPLAGSVPLIHWSDRVPAHAQWALRDLQVRDAEFPCPRLLLLDESQDAVLKESLRCAGAADDSADAATANPAICGWLFARGVSGDAPRHLVAAMQQRNAKFEPVLLRYYDPRVLSRLNQILDGEQRQQLLGPVEHWFSLDRFGEFVDLQIETAVPYVVPTLTASPEQWADIQRIEARNQSIALFAQATGNSLPTNREVELDAALSRAETHGIVSLDDAITFALYSLTVAPGFDQHPSVAAALTNIRSGQAKLADALESIPEQVWHDITHPTEQMEQS